MTGKRSRQAGNYTAEDFMLDYAHRSHVTVSDLQKHFRVVVPCRCGYEGCSGWAMMPQDLCVHDVTSPTGWSEELRAPWIREREE